MTTQQQKSPGAAVRSFSLSELRRLAIVEGRFLEAGQEALVKAGLRQVADAATIERAQGLYALARLADAIIADPRLNQVFKEAIARRRPIGPYPAAEADDDEPIDQAEEADA